MTLHQNSIDSYREEKELGNPKIFRIKILELLKTEGRPMTDREIFTALNETDVNNIRPEITRLIQRGNILEIDRVKCGVTRKTVRRTMFNYCRQID